MILARLRTLCALLCWRLRVPLVILGAAAVGSIAASLTNYAIQVATTWPYPTPLRRMVGEGGATSDRELVKIRYDGDIVMQRLIDYQREDCRRWYIRRAVSKVPDALGAFRSELLPLVYDPELPVYLSGEWQEWRAPLPTGFPCGPAYLAETVTASCNWLHWFFPLTKPVIKTPFEVTGCDKPPPG